MSLILSNNPNPNKKIQTDPTMDELLPQQAAHHVGAEVNNVLDLPEGLLHRLEGKNTDS